jgi:hypothetical protein
MIKLEHNPKLGVYYVGRQLFYNKLEAFVLAEKTGAKIRWDFNDAVYGKIDWKIEPAEEINELYRQRAQQLRDRYDYVILNFSGGSDSTNILYAFLKNNIHLDEIIVRHPESGLKNVDINNADMSSSNQISEYEYAVLPRLRWVKDHFPKVKITIHDYFKSMVDENIDETWVFSAREYLHPGVIKRYSNLSLRSQFDLYEQGKSIGIIYGIDKPRLQYIDNKFYAHFIDVHANVVVNEIDDYTNISTELFYWTPDMPKIAVKQAHLAMKSFNTDQRRQMILPDSKAFDLNGYIEREILAPAIYPTIEHDIFQGDKITNAVFSQHDSWFWDNHMNSKIVDTWKAGIELIKKISPTKITVDANGNIRNLNTFKSNLYPLN